LILGNEAIGDDQQVIDIIATAHYLPSYAICG